MYHNPVLLNESISGLKINPSGIYVDVTYGGGGHSQEILKNLNSNPSEPLSLIWLRA